MYFSLAYLFCVDKLREVMQASSLCPSTWRKLGQAHSTEVAAVRLELHMPGMGGVATYHTLRSIDPLLPIIIFTAYDPTEVRPYFPAQETVPVLEKHCDHKQLLATLTDVLTKRRGQ